MPLSIRGRDLVRVLVAALALACASPSSQDAASHQVVHEGFGIRVDLDGWQVYRDATSAPRLMRPIFEGKKGPDDPPLFVAMRDDAAFILLVKRGVALDSQTFFESFVSSLGPQGEVTQAARLPGSDDIVSTYRVGSGVVASYSRTLVHVEDGLLVNAILVKAGQVPTEELFADALRRIELRRDRDGKWESPWDLRPPIAGEALAGYEGGEAPEPAYAFERVECAPGQHPLLWVVPTRSGGRLYLFGSIHVGHPSFYPFAAPIEQAFDGAERLVVEVDPGTLPLQSGSLPEGQRLSDVVSPELYDRLGEAAKQLGIPLEMFDGLSPGMASVVLTVAPLVARGFGPAAGVDKYFVDHAKDKQIVELETAQQQLALVDSFDENFLRATLDALETFDADLRTLHRAWSCGDEAGLTQALLEVPRERAQTPEERAVVDHYNRVFLFDRNRSMAKRIEELMDADGDSFVVVGTAHLVGEQGIPALLRAAGHPVETVGP